MDMLEQLRKIIEGADGDLSIRRVLALVFAVVTIIGIFVEAVGTDKVMISAGLVCSLLLLTTWQNAKDNPTV